MLPSCARALFTHLTLFLPFWHHKLLVTKRQTNTATDHANLTQFYRGLAIELLKRKFDVRALCTVLSPGLVGEQKSFYNIFCPPMDNSADGRPDDQYSTQVLGCRQIKRERAPISRYTQQHQRKIT
eukprot:COSAG02_NODE_4616_length_5160_cov_2.446750_3_plen_126_part_00